MVALGGPVKPAMRDSVWGSRAAPPRRHAANKARR